MSTMPVGGLVPRATDNAADLVVRNAKIHTGDPVRPQAGLAGRLERGGLTVHGRGPLRVAAEAVLAMLSTASTGEIIGSSGTRMRTAGAGFGGQP